MRTSERVERSGGADGSPRGFSGRALPRFGGLLAAGLLLALGACKSEGTTEKKDYGRPLPEGAPALERITDLGTLPDLKVVFSRRKGAIGAIEESLGYFAKPSSKTWFPYAAPDREITHADQIESLQLLQRHLEEAGTPSELEGRLLNSFDFYRSVGWDGSGEVLYTAYCEPIFDGRMQREGAFRYPLYRAPDGLERAADGTPLGMRQADGSVGPSPTREEIDRGQLYVGNELVWLDDPFAVYVAQVQGSARIRLPGGEQLCVGYGGKTEHPYRSIGQALIEQGVIERDELSLPRLERYFEENPTRLNESLWVNPSYVFFTEREPGPFGSLNTKVTPYHTVATDKSVFPRGGPVLVAMGVPQFDALGATRFRRTTLLAFDQDTGGAIRSAGRADLFLGTGDGPKTLAGHTREEGRLIYLFAKPKDAQP